MGATSVTGVSGPGSVAGNQKGSENMSLGVGKLIGPRVMCAGSATIGLLGTVDVDFPPLGGALADYITLATDTNAVVAAVNVTTFGLDGITLTGTVAHVVNWAVLKVGNS